MDILEVNCATGETTIKAATKAEIALRKRLQEAAEAKLLLG